MQKYRFIQYLAGGLLVGLLIGQGVFAQPQDPWRQFYRQRNWPALQRMIQQNQIPDPCWRQFLMAIFTENADSAVSTFAQLYQQCTDPDIREGIRERVFQYYYARGYYETARKIQSDEAFFLKILSIKNTATRYGVQVGAFSTYANALKLKQQLEGTVQPVRIINKTHNGGRLFTVVGGEFSRREDAVAFLQRLKQQLGISGYVVEY